MKKISWYDFSFWGNEKQYVNEALDSTWLSGGGYIEKFEKSLSQKLELPNVFVVANGTAALQLAFLAIDIKPGDEVIVPAFGFLAAANVLKLMHAVPVFADVDKTNWCLDLVNVEEKITAKTKAVVAIHNYGVVADMQSLKQLTKKHGVYLIEDCAESIFSRYDGKYCGTFGDVSTFSFHATKTIATGEGGMISSDEEAICDKIKLIRSHGLRREKKHYWHEYYGNNFRISNLLAAIGYGQFEKSEEIIEEKKRILNKYQQQLDGLQGVSFQGIPDRSDPIIWAVAIYLDPLIISKHRDDIMRELSSAGIETRPGFYTPDQLDIYEEVGADDHTIANDLAKSIVVLPSFPKLSDENIEYICNFLKSAIR